VPNRIAAQCDGRINVRPQRCWRYDNDGLSLDVDNGSTAAFMRRRRSEGPDDPFADLIGAKKLGMSTCWVLTGSVKDRAASGKIPLKYRPDYINNSIIEIPH
jgi:hypothetical protein